MSDLGLELDPWEMTKPLDLVEVDGRRLAVGDRVRLAPAGSADIFDIALRGQPAVVVGLEQDFENVIHVAVVLDDDPGRDLGMARQPGHRFFFKPNEVVPI